MHTHSEKNCNEALTNIRKTKTNKTKKVFDQQQKQKKNKRFKNLS